MLSKKDQKQINAAMVEMNASIGKAKIVTKQFWKSYDKLLKTILKKTKGDKEKANKIVVDKLLNSNKSWVKHFGFPKIFNLQDYGDNVEEAIKEGDRSAELSITEFKAYGDTDLVMHIGRDQTYKDFASDSGEDDDDDDDDDEEVIDWNAVDFYHLCCEGAEYMVDEFMSLSKMPEVPRTDVSDKMYSKYVKRYMIPINKVLTKALKPFAKKYKVRNITSFVNSAIGLKCVTYNFHVFSEYGGYDWKDIESYWDELTSNSVRIRKDTLLKDKTFKAEAKKVVNSLKPIARKLIAIGKKDKTEYV